MGGLLGLLAAGYLGICLYLQRSEPIPVFGSIPDSPLEQVAPAGFLWGVATSAHQIEGGNEWSDWARFEQTNAQGGHGEESGLANDHWNRVEEDIGLISALGANAYRFSIEWSRLEPSPGEWAEEAWLHYEDEVRRLQAAGIEPMVTLLHFTIPAWLADLGGLTASEFPDHFARFAGEAARRLGSNVDLWCTLNEPNVQMIQGYVEGIWPPEISDTSRASAAVAGLLRAHAASSQAIRDNDPDAEIGMAVNLIVFDPSSRWSLPDWVAADQADSGFNWAFYESIAAERILFELAGFPPLDEPLDGLAESTDFIGINYYRRNMVRFDPSAPGLVELQPGPGELSDSGVEIYPEGLLRLLRRAWKRYGKPIYITENGVSDAADKLRAGYLRGHAYAVARALEEGIAVRGYFHWSLLDNFEWTEGFGPRFGLYRVDYETLERQPTAGSREFQRISASLDGIEARP